MKNLKFKKIVNTVVFAGAVALMGMFGSISADAASISLANGSAAYVAEVDGLETTITGRVIVANQAVNVGSLNGSVYCVAQPGIRVYEYMTVNYGGTTYSLIQYGTDNYAFTKTSAWYAEGTANNTASENTASSKSTLSTAGLVRDNVTDYYWNTAVSAWNLLPQSLRDAYVESGSVYYVTSSDFWTAAGYSSLSGITYLYSDGRTVQYVRAANNKRVAMTIIHEVGHWVDYINGYASSSDEFYQYYLEEKDSFEGYQAVGDGHYTSSVKEYFAQIFSQIYVAPDTESSAPKSFAYVRQFLFE